jgi:UDP-2-acetamido-3-amino-2,3-dideoxy-glucuronate N-acetyltransferase
MSQEPFICLIGAGRWGANLLRDFHGLGALHSVCESSPLLLDKYRDTYTDLVFYTDISQIDQSVVSAVVIATPATCHFEMVTQCLNMGFDVYVEKPLALKYSEGVKLVALANLVGKRLMVGHLLQYHPAIMSIKQMIKDDLVGKIRYIKSNRLNLGQIRTGENVLWSFAPHDISVILSLLGGGDERLPNRLICDGYSAITPPICDSTTTIMHFDNQYAEICVNWLYPFKEQSLIIVGDRGMITFKDSRTDPELLLYPQPVTTDHQGNILVNKLDPKRIEFDTKISPLTIECKHFIDCCRDPTLTCRTDGLEALHVLAVLEMAQHSLENNGISVTPDCLKSEDLNEISVAADRGVVADKVEVVPSVVEVVPSVVDYYVHPTAIVENGCVLGKGSKVWQWCHLMPSIIGADCSFGQCVYVGKGVKMGDHCRIQNNVNIYSGVELESGVFLGPNCTTTNDKNPRAEFTKGGQYVKTLIRKGATVGAAAVIVCGVTLGEYCMVGAGAVVTKDVPAYALVVGNPARVIGSVDQKGVITRF